MAVEAKARVLLGKEGLGMRHLGVVVVVVGWMLWMVVLREVVASEGTETPVADHRDGGYAGQEKQLDKKLVKIQ